MIRFIEEWEAGYIDGFVLMPVLSDSIFELYRLWCVKQGVKPGSQQKLIDNFIRRKGAEKRRCRFIGNASRSMNPKTFIFPEGIDGPPEGKTETAWLGNCVSEFIEFLGKYNGNYYKK
jgi:putative DNA primase/helicase